MSINIKVFELNFGMTHVGVRSDGQMTCTRMKSEKVWKNNWITMEWGTPEAEGNKQMDMLRKELKQREPIYDFDVL